MTEIMFCSLVSVDFVSLGEEKEPDHIEAEAVNSKEELVRYSCNL